MYLSSMGQDEQTIIGGLPIPTAKETPMHMEFFDEFLRDRKAAEKQFGVASYCPGSTSPTCVNVPNTTSSFAKKYATAWSRLYLSMEDDLDVVGVGHTDYYYWKKGREHITDAFGIAHMAGSTLTPSQARSYWGHMQEAASRADQVQMTPSQAAQLMGFLKGTLNELVPDLPILRFDWLKWTAIGTAGIGAIWLAMKLKPRGSNNV